MKYLKDMKRIFFKTISLSLLALVTVGFVGCEKDSDIKQYDYPAPKVTSYYPVSGYTHTEVTILGEDFGNSVKDKDGNNIAPVKVYFGGIEAKEILSCKNNCIVVKVPEDALSGDIDLQVWMHEVTVGHYTVVPAPTVSSILSDNENFGSTAAIEGDEVTITGTGFGADKGKVSVDFNGTSAQISSLSDTEIKVITPAGYESGEISVTVNGFKVIAGALMNPDSKGEVTMFYLKNYKNPQSMSLTSAQAGSKINYGIPKDWTCTSNMLNKKNDGATDWTGSMIIDASGNFFSIAAGWGKDPEPTDETTPNDNYIKNGKMYQRTTLPAGSYTLQIDVKAHGNSPSELYYIVAKLGDEFPDYNDIVGNEQIVAFISDNLGGTVTTPYTVSMDFELDESTEVFIGMSLNFKKSIYYDFYGFRLILR